MFILVNSGHKGHKTSHRFTRKMIQRIIVWSGEATTTSTKTNFTVMKTTCFTLGNWVSLQFSFCLWETTVIICMIMSGTMIREDTSTIAKKEEEENIHWFIYIKDREILFLQDLPVKEILKWSRFRNNSLALSNTPANSLALEDLKEKSHLFTFYSTLLF